MLRVNCMALVQHYLQDDSWRYCSKVSKLVSVSQHRRQPINLYTVMYNMVMIYGAQGRQIVTCMHHVVLEIKEIKYYYLIFLVYM